MYSGLTSRPSGAATGDTCGDILKSQRAAQHGNAGDVAPMGESVNSSDETAQRA